MRFAFGTTPALTGCLLAGSLIASPLFAGCLFAGCLFAGSLGVGSLGVGAALAAEPISVVAAENFYGDVARQIGGAHVAVTSILANPDEDPHLFETSPSTAAALAGAAIVIANGADYDPWMTKLLSASATPRRTLIVAADLVGAHAGDNPHLWYDPKTLPAVARDVAAKLAARDPADAALFKANLEAFDASFAPIVATVDAIKAKHAGTVVTATEPVFGYMAEALGFTMLNYDFQVAVMNDAEPSPSQVAGFEDSLKGGKVRILFYNSQVTDKTTARLMGLAKAAHVAVVGVSETEPKGMDVQAWFAGQLKAVSAALAAKGT